MNAWERWKKTGEVGEVIETAAKLASDGAKWGYVWRVTYRRDDWKPDSKAVRYYARAGHAWNFVEKLAAGRDDLSAVEFTLERIRTLGDWEVVHERA